MSWHMSVRTSKVQTKAGKVTKPKLVKDLKVARRPRASRKAVASTPDPIAEAPKTEEMQLGAVQDTVPLQNEISGAQPSMQENQEFQEFQSVIYFDGGWYLDMYPDVREAGIDPLEHFLNHGSQEGRSPNALFDSQAYLRANPDVVEFERGPFIHYICFGFQEKRPLR
ncbi:hypothetical protein [Acetobacter cerevisiae]|uniref:hypothetical protein n=1 Tax=Acetobacter cerevisiae TaxID=178900 RepID=UPI001E63C5FB|nr:hypothetical protein [Acetobacter cerevisiae]